nr:histidine phosphatase family protein [Motilibacter aurantiacus]
MWRHGRTVWNAQLRFQGQTDVPLDEVGVDQARRAARMLASLDPALIVASDLQRAADTAAALAAVTGLEVLTDAGLRETNAGAWQGLTSAQIAEQFPDEWSAWHRGEPDVRPGGGETRLEVAARACDTLAKAVAQVGPGETVVAVTHGGAARTALASLIGLPSGVWGALGGLSNCNWSVLTEDGERGEGLWRLMEHNAGSLPEPVLTEEG